MTPRKSTKHIVIHCSATRPSQDVGVTEIRRWHKNQGWKDIGYHFVIKRDGTVQRGRAENLVGAHALPQIWNQTSVAICMVGGVKQDNFQIAENNFTKPQWASLKKLIGELSKKYPGTKVLGHRDIPRVAKACPSFDAIAWAKKEGFQT